MDISLFKEFGTIVQCGSLSEAAKMLHMTQPALTRHMNTLEQELGLKLLDRTTTPVKLLPAGEVFLEFSYNISSEHAKLLNRMSQLRRTTISTLRVLNIYSPKMGRAVREAKRELENDLLIINIKQDETSSWQPPFDLLRAGELDVAIEAASPFVDDVGLESVPLVTEPVYLVLEVSNPLAKQESFSGEDLSEIRFKYAKSSLHYSYRQHLRWLCQLNGVAAKSISLADATTTRDLFLNGLGECAIMVPETCALMQTAGNFSDFVMRPYVGKEPNYDIRAFYPKNASETTMRFVETLKEAVDRHNQSC